MSTDYDPIAERYRRAKTQPWRTHVEAFTFLALIGDARGLSVLDVACGEGYYTRRVRELGARRVTGIDLSPGMIDLARREEAQRPLGIEYLVGDARDLPLAEPFDLVVAAFLLNHARNRDELRTMCAGVARCLAPGGRFVTVNCNPALDFSNGPSYRKYGFEITAPPGQREGSPITCTIFLDDDSFTIEDYSLSPAVHEEALRAAGFREVRWHPPRVDPAARAAFPAGYWDLFLEQPAIAFLEAV